MKNQLLLLNNVIRVHFSLSISLLKNLFWILSWKTSILLLKHFFLGLTKTTCSHIQIYQKRETSFINLIGFVTMGYFNWMMSISHKYRINLNKTK